MSYKRSLVLIKLLIFILTISYINSQVVCSEDELISELYEDLIDNGKLDCLRRSVTPTPGEETKEKREIRIAAEWNSDCSFEADDTGENNWIQRLKTTYGLTKGLVDVNGETVEKDFEDQADMCELVRALVANGKFPEIGEDVKSIDIRLIDLIDCPGIAGQTEACAANAGSFAQKKGWYIFLEGKTLTVKGEPKFQQDK